MKFGIYLYNWKYIIIFKKYGMNIKSISYNMVYR